MQIDESQFVAEFAKRTKANLDRIRELEKSGEPVFEVTQLVNSLLGLLVYPKEKYLNTIPETPIGELQADGWPLPVVARATTRGQDLRDLVTVLRHATAHGGIQFVHQAEEIVGIRFTNRYRNKEVWQGYFDIDGLDGFVMRLIDAMGLIAEPADSPETLRVQPGLRDA